MIRNFQDKKGFTLIELMIVVAIIGILAAIAIPNFIAMQLRSKRSELPTNVDAIRTAEKAYESEWDAYTSTTAAPTTGVPVKTQENFGFSFGSGTNWDLLGWVADGKVRAQYQVEADNTGISSTQNFSANAVSDIDGDTVNAHYSADKNVKSEMNSLNSVY